MLLKLKKNKKGFTLIELIVVVAILAILAAIAVPNFIGLSAKAQKGVDVANATSIVSAVNVYNSLNPKTKIVAKTGITSAALKDLWPAGIDDTAAAPAITRIEFTDATSGVAYVKDASVS